MAVLNRREWITDRKTFVSLLWILCILTSSLVGKQRSGLILWFYFFSPSHYLGYFWLLAGGSANGHSPVLNLSQHSSRPSNSSGSNNNLNNNPTTNGPGGPNSGEHSGSENAYNVEGEDDVNDSEDDDDDDREEGNLYTVQ